MNFYEHTLIAKQDLSTPELSNIEKKYKDIINMSLLFMYGYSVCKMKYEDFTDKDLSFLTGYLQNGIKEGWYLFG